MSLAHNVHEYIMPNFKHKESPMEMKIILELNLLDKENIKFVFTNADIIKSIFKKYSPL
ncbi:MAG: hypothetical protein ACOZBL_04865 [Patescibacteria group bacterium]